MHPDLQKYLDGTLSRAELAPELRAEADAWDELTDAALGMRAERAPANLAMRVLAALPADAPARSRWRDLVAAWLQPREVAIRPVYGLLAAAAVSALLFVPRARTAPDAPAPAVASADAAAADAPVIYVRFSFQAPDARTVALAGDFNDWQSGALALTDADGDGVWSGTFALEPGVHKYMFVVDDERWETDPVAENYIDDGFGMRNALIAIAPPMQRAM
jgi:hypothetical protein